MTKCQIFHLHPTQMSHSRNSYAITMNDICHDHIIIDREAREIIGLVASVRPVVCLFVCLRSPVWTVAGLEYAFYTMCMLRSGQYMGSACRVLRKNTMTHEIQSKTSVCLSVIKEHSRSKSCAQRSGAFNFLFPVGPLQFWTNIINFAPPIIHF